MQVEWKGIYPAITTKFCKDGSLDLEMFEKNLKAQLSAGIHGIVLGGSLGEASTLKPEEKLYLLERTLKVAGDRIPVIVNIAEKVTDDAIKAAELAQANGAHGLMMLPPLQYNADDRETVAFIKAVANSTDLPVMIYNNPVSYGIEITVEMFGELIECENIQAVKDSTHDLTNITRLINRFGDRIKILCGVDTLALEALLLGASGWVAGLVCAFPNETVTIYELVKAGRVSEAIKIYRWFMPLLELDIHPKLVQYIKLAEAANGMGTEYVRPPRLPLVGKERKQVLHTINRALEIRPELPHVGEFIRS